MTSSPHSVDPGPQRPGSAQLDLFSLHIPPPARLSAAAARAAVSPGWWPPLAVLWDADEEFAKVVVTCCREADGVLELEAVALGEPPDVLADTLARIRSVVGQLCGCCGARGASAYRRRVDEPTRVACTTCRARLAAGEEYLQIANEYWRLDGSARVQRAVSRARVPPWPAAPTEPDDDAAPPVPAPAPAPAETRSLDEPLPAGELRRVIAEIREQLGREVLGQEQAVARLALVAGLHVGAASPRGARVLLAGPTGVGKSTLLAALRAAVAPWQMPFCVTDAIDLSSPGWSGAPSIGDLLEDALGRERPSSPRGRRAIVVIDEIHHVRRIRGTHGNMDAKRQEVLSSLLGLCGHGTVHLGDSTREYDCRQTLVIACGAFTGLDLTPPLTVSRLTRWGIPLELANRLTEEVLVLRPLPEADLIALLRRWPALVSLTETCARLGYAVRIPDESYARAARVLTLGRDAGTPRTAGGWLVSALRAVLLQALEHSESMELVVAPDSLPIPVNATRP